MADKDGQAKPGFTGNMRKAFRKLCHNAGAGVNLVNLVPSDNYLSVLCGGLKVIFMALQQTDRYRKDIYNALEDLPFILTDHAAMVELDRSDEELHRRVAALYTSLFKLMEAIFSWFLKGSLGRGLPVHRDLHCRTSKAFRAGDTESAGKLGGLRRDAEFFVTCSSCDQTIFIVHWY